MASTHVINELIIHDDDLPSMLEALWWLSPDAIKLEDHRYLLVLEVACNDPMQAPAYCSRRLHKAAYALGITLATGDVEVVGHPPVPSQ